MKKHFSWMSNRQIGQQLQISEKYVRRYVAQYLSKGYLRNNYSRSGRSNKLDQREEKRFTCETLKHSMLPLTTCINKFNAYEKIDKHFSYATGWRLLNNNNIVSRVLEPIYLIVRKSFYYQ